MDFDLASTSSAAGTEYGSYFTISDTGAVASGTDTTYGNRIDVTRTGASAGVINGYGQYISVSGDLGGNMTLYGSYVTVSGADNPVGAYVSFTESTTGSGTAYGQRIVSTSTAVNGASATSLDISLTDTGVTTTGVDVVAGANIAVTRTGATGGLINSTALSLSVSSDNAGAGTSTSTALSIDTNTPGTVNADTVYGIQLYTEANASTTAYGIYTDVGTGAGTEYSGIFLNGNFGIGDSTPDHLLDVAGNIGLNASSYINFGDTDGSTGYGLRDNAGTIEYKNSAGSWTAFGGGGMSIGGTVTSGTTGSILFVGASSALTQDNTNFFWDDTNNRLGLGTTSPEAQLSILGTSNALRLSYNVSNYGALSTDSSGNLSITSSNTSESRLLIGNGGSVDAHVAFDGASVDFHSGIDHGTTAYVIGSGLVPGTSDYVSISSTGSFSVTGLVSCGGVQTNASGTMSCTSDARLKDVQGAYTPGLDSIMQVEPQVYSWKQGSGLYDGGVLYSGFIAQNIESAIPGAANINPQGYLQINTTSILAATINAVKEVNTLRIEDKEAASDVTDALNLSVSGVVTSVSDLQAAVTNDLQNISGDITNLNTNVTTISNDVAGLDARTTTLETQMQTLTDQVQTLSEFYTTFDLGNVVAKDLNGDVDLMGGKLRARVLETGAMVIETVNVNAPTLGTGTIVSGQTQVVIPTEAVVATSRIFVTAKAASALNFPLTVTNITPGTGFTVSMPAIEGTDIDFDWWIVQSH